MPMELRPRPPGREFRGYTRVSTRRWIKDPHDRVIVPDHIALLSSAGYAHLFKQSEKHRSAVKKNPNISAPLEKDFYEPEIDTVRRSKKRKYLQRHPDMAQPERFSFSSTSSTSSSSNSTSTFPKSRKKSTADIVITKIEVLVGSHFSHIHF